MVTPLFLIVDGLVKSQKNNLLSFRRKPESSNSNMFWMPDQVRHDGIRLFTGASIVKGKKTLIRPLTISASFRARE
jgi:hypothetical protein